MVLPPSEDVDSSPGESGQPLGTLPRESPEPLTLALIGPKKLLIL